MPCGRNAMRPRFSSNLAMLGLTCIALLIPTVATVQPSSNTLRFVRGVVVVTVGPTQAERKVRDIALPHASVSLVRPSDVNAPLASALSDLSGRFIIKTDLTGDFSLCVAADGFTRTCAPKRFTLGSAPSISYGTLPIAPLPAADRYAVAYGTVLLRDGHRARGFDPFLGVNNYARVELSTGSGTLYKGFVNNFG